jgi:hypothetical protein
VSMEGSAASCTAAQTVRHRNVKMKKHLLVKTKIYKYCFYITPLKISVAEIFNKSHIVWNPHRTPLDELI